MIETYSVHGYPVLGDAVVGYEKQFGLDISIYSGTDKGC